MPIHARDRCRKAVGHTGTGSTPPGGEDELTWFEAMPSLPLDFVMRHLRPDDAFIDVGAGASRLVDALLDERFIPQTIPDISASALAVSKECLDFRTQEVAWIEADVTHWEPDRSYGVWYDRAVFHFLTAPEDAPPTPES